MRSFRAFFAVLALLLAQALLVKGVAAQTPLGPQGPEGEFNRVQPWLVPSTDPAIPSHAVLFRPPGDGPFRLALIAHASTQNELYRAQMPQPEYRPLAAWLVARGFVVLVPERLGHGATGGSYVEDQHGCDGADYPNAARATAAQISAALNYIRTQPFVRREGALLIGHSAGGWGALALATADPTEISGMVVFAPGRGGQAYGLPNRTCAPHLLIATAGEFGRGARVPVSWLVAANDSYFSPDISRKMADAFRDAGGKVDFHALGPYDGEGHWMAETENGVKFVGPELDRVLKAQLAARTKKP